MRIAIVSTYYPFPPAVGGVETIVRNTATELAKRGYEIHIITTPFDVTTMKQVSDYGVEMRDGVIIHKLRPERIRVGYARVLRGLREAIEQLKPEIVHSHNLHPHLFQLAKWKKNLGYKLIAELHYPVVELDFLIQKLAMPFAVMWLKRISQNIDSFIAHTLLEKKWLMSLRISAEKIAIVRFPAISSKLLSVETNPKPLDDIIYLGRIVYRKGIHILLRALALVKKRFNRVRANIAGPADPKYLNYLKMLVKELGLENNVSFIGVIEESRKYEFIRMHKILVLPSLADYHPIVLLEAQALGIPVIATKVGAISEIVVDRRTGILVNPSDPHGLAKAIILLIEDEGFRKRMSLRAREWARNFILEKRVEELEKLYHAVLHG